MGGICWKRTKQHLYIINYLQYDKHDTGVISPHTEPFNFNFTVMRNSHQNFQEEDVEMYEYIAMPITIRDSDEAFNYNDLGDPEFRKCRMNTNLPFSISDTPSKESGLLGSGCNAIVMISQNIETYQWQATKLGLLSHEWSEDRGFSYQCKKNMQYTKPSKSILLI